MWQRFTEPARKSVFYAHERAFQLECIAVQPDHLFLGCLKTDDLNGMRLLNAFGFDFDEVRTATEAEVSRHTDHRVAMELTLAPRTKRVCDRAYDAARTVGDHFVDVEHLLVGLVGDSHSVFGTSARKRKVTEDDLLAMVKKFRRMEAPSPPDGLAGQLAKVHPLDALAVVAIREIKLRVSINEAAQLQGLLNGMDRVFAANVTRSGSDPIAETMADAVHLASQRRESLAAGHMLAAIYRRAGTAVNLAAPDFYANPDEMMDRLVFRGE